MEERKAQKRAMGIEEEDEEEEVEYDAENDELIVKPKVS